MDESMAPLGTFYTTLHSRASRIQPYGCYARLHGFMRGLMHRQTDGYSQYEMDWMIAVVN